MSFMFLSVKAMIRLLTLSVQGCTALACIFLIMALHWLDGKWGLHPGIAIPLAIFWFIFPYLIDHWFDKHHQITRKELDRLRRQGLEDFIDSIEESGVQKPVKPFRGIK